MAKITLTNIIEELAARTGMSKDAADNFVHAIVDTIHKGLQEDNLVKIKGLGTFKLMEVSDRGSVDVNTGERITIKGHRKVSFTPDSAMKEFVNRPFAHFEPTELNDGYPSEEEELLVAEEEARAEGSEAPQQNQEPIAEVSMVEEPAIEEPIVEAPVAEEPVIEELVTEMPVVETPAEEEPISSDMTAEEEVVENSNAEDAAEATITEQEVPVAEEQESPILSEVDTEDKEEEDIQPAEEVTTEEDAPAATESVEEPEVLVVAPEPSPAEEASEPEEAPATAPQQEEEPVLDATSESANTASEKPAKRGILGWIVVILLIAIALGLYYYTAKDLFTQSDEYYEKFDAPNNMMVNPNLREELGEEWADEPQVQTKLPTQKKEDVVAAKPEESGRGEIAADVKEQEAQKTAEPANAPVATALAADGKICIVTLTETLEAKDIKDITPADTTDYVIDGTLVTHQLRNGETIIQLAKKYYGDKRLWPYIVKYNWMKDYNHVAIGQMINIPVLKDKSAL